MCPINAIASRSGPKKLDKNSVGAAQLFPIHQPAPNPSPQFPFPVSAPHEHAHGDHGGAYNPTALAPAPSQAPSPSRSRPYLAAADLSCARRRPRLRSAATQAVRRRAGDPGVAALPGSLPHIYCFCTGSSTCVCWTLDCIYPTLVLSKSASDGQNQARSRQECHRQKSAWSATPF